MLMHCSQLPLGATMQGINKKQHEYLLSALQQLEHVLTDIELSTQDKLLEELPASADIKKIKEKLQQDYLKYEDMLEHLAMHIKAYNDLSHQVRVYHIGKLLKRLKREKEIYAAHGIHIIAAQGT